MKAASREAAASERRMPGKAGRNLNPQRRYKCGGIVFLKKMGATVHVVIGAYVLLGIMLALYLNINIFIISLQGITPFVVLVAGLFAISDLVGGLLEFAKNDDDDEEPKKRKK